MAFRVEFVSPESVLFSDEATQVIARTRGGGEIAFLTGHEPFIGSLVPSEVRVTLIDGSTKRFIVRGGFVSVNGTREATEVTVLSDAAVAADVIDRDEVESELATAREALRLDEDDVYAQDDVTWAEVRLAAIEGTV